MKLYNQHDQFSCFLNFISILFLFNLASDEASSFESGHCQKILALKFHPEDKDIMLTAGWDHSVKVIGSRLTFRTDWYKTHGLKCIFDNADW